MGRLLDRIDKYQRVEMIEAGLNPLNDDHVKKFLKGDVSKNEIQENLDRVKNLFGDIATRDLGHGKHRDVDPNVGGEYVPGSDMPTRDVRQTIMEDMDSYANDIPDYSSKLLSLKEKQRPTAAKGKMNLNEVTQVGKKLATNYYNAFIMSLKNPSTQANVEVYKAIKSLLEQEKALKDADSPALPHFRKAVQGVTSAMYQQLKG